MPWRHVRYKPHRTPCPPREISVQLMNGTMSSTAGIQNLVAGTQRSRIIEPRWLGTEAHTDCPHRARERADQCRLPLCLRDDYRLWVH